MYRILIADDSNYMRESLRAILQESGHEVVAEAKSGLNAVELFKALAPDIVMLDTTMPDGSGLGTLEKIMALNPNALVIMLAVVGKPDIVLNAVNGGAKSYLTKPFDKTSVLQALKQATV